MRADVSTDPAPLICRDAIRKCRQARHSGRLALARPASSRNGARIGPTACAVLARTIGAPGWVHVQATEAFRVRGLPGLPSSGQVIYGTRSAGCPRNYLGPQPVTAITLAPHKAGHWIATILLTVTAPGSYHFSKAKITYTVDGVKNWQYQDLGLVVSYTDPPRPELAHIYRQDDGCDAL
jgi:hypothetical protein